MKHADDDEVNETLRKALRNKFDTADDQAEPELANMIFNSIKRKNPYIFPVVLLILIFSFFLATIPTGDNRLLTNDNAFQHVSRKKSSGFSKPIKNIEGNKKRKDLLISNNYSGGNQETKSDIEFKEKLINKHDFLDAKNGPEIDIALKAIVANSKIPDNGNIEKQVISNAEDVSINNNISNIDRNESKGKIRPQISINPKPLSNDTNGLKIIADSLSVSENEEANNDLHPELLIGRSYLDVKPDYKLEMVKVPAKEVNAAAFNDQRKPWNLIVGFIPMNTFQVVRINPVQSNQYQNFSFPSNFTSKKIAYKFQVGIEKRGIQLLANYSRIQQTYSYEVATDEYVLDNANKQFNIIREGIHQEYSSTLNLIGVGLKKSLTVHHGALRTYFLNTGLDFSRDLTSKQNVIWGTAGFGKEIALNNHTSLMIGPYLEYSFSKLVNNQTPFQVKPYQVGISFNFKFRKGENARKSD